MTILYRLSTSFVVVKTVLENIRRSSKNFVVVKTGLSNFYRPSTGFGEVRYSARQFRLLQSLLNVGGVAVSPFLTTAKPVEAL